MTPLWRDRVPLFGLAVTVMAAAIVTVLLLTGLWAGWRTSSLASAMAHRLSPEVTQDLPDDPQKPLAGAAPDDATDGPPDVPPDTAADDSPATAPDAPDVTAADDTPEHTGDAPAVTDEDPQAQASETQPKDAGETKQEDLGPGARAVARVHQRHLFSPEPPKAAHSILGVLGDRVLFPGGGAVGVGESFNGATVKAIGPDWAELEVDGKVVKFSVFNGQVASPPAQPGVAAQGADAETASSQTDEGASPKSGEAASTQPQAKQSPAKAPSSDYSKQTRSPKGRDRSY